VPWKNTLPVDNAFFTSLSEGEESINQTILKNSDAVTVKRTASLTIPSLPQHIWIRVPNLNFRKHIHKERERERERERLSHIPTHSHTYIQTHTHTHTHTHTRHTK